MQLLLIRHAQSEHSQRNLIADTQACLGLTATGYQQAQALCRRFLSTGEISENAVLLTSPVVRARQTASVLHLVFPKIQLLEDERLCELRPGVADGLTWPEYAQQHGEFDLVSEPDRPFAPGGESWVLFLDRVTSLFDTLADVYGDKQVVAITHAGFIVASLLTSFAIPRPGTQARFEPSYTGITEWSLTPQGRILERYNDAFHLRQV